MDIVTVESVDVIVEVICGIVILSLLSFTVLGNQIIPIMERLL